MKINKQKSKVIFFNPRSRTVDFKPTVKLNGELLEVVEKMRLVGLIVSDDLKWKENTDSIRKRAYQKLWIIRRLRQLGAETNILLLIYYRHVRSILEFAVPVWNGGITKNEEKKIEAVQKVALCVIFGKGMSYKEMCNKYKIEKLTTRRKKLCLNFAKKALMHEKFTDWFVKNGEAGIKSKYLETVSRQKRLLKSPIPYLTKLLNENIGGK